MSLTAAVLAGRLSTGLGVARWGRWLAAMGVVAAVSLGAGTWAGVRWERGAQALSNLKETREALRARNQQIEDMRVAAEEIRQAGVTAAQDYRTAALRMETIANEYANRDQARLRAFDRTLEAARAPLLRDRPDLWGCDIGERLLEHWNRASRGPGAGAADAAAADSGNAAGAVRADAGRDRQSSAGADPAARSRDGGAP